jgi:mitochondrial fission protein ELM1
LHHVTPEKLELAARNFAPSVAHLSSPRVAVLIGGSNAVYDFTPTVAGDLADRLLEMARNVPCSLLVTPSRRTPPDAVAILQARLRPVGAMVWDGQGENPYLAYLGLADAVVVTADSVSMTSEACSTGKPVYVVEMEGGGAKFNAFHQALRTAGLTRRFDGTLSTWNYVPMNDTVQVADTVRERMARRSESNQRIYGH